MSNLINSFLRRIGRVRAIEALDDAYIVREVTRVVRDADEMFENTGGGSCHWVRECFLPLLDEAGLMIVRKP